MQQSALQARGVDLDLTFEHHTGQRHVRKPHHRPDTCQHPTTRNANQRFFLQCGRLHMLHKTNYSQIPVFNVGL